MLAGETIASGAPSTCAACFVTPPYEVLRSAAGYYIGTICECGPYSRESGFYRNQVEAEAALHLGTFSRNSLSPSPYRGARSDWQQETRASSTDFSRT